MAGKPSYEELEQKVRRLEKDRQRYQESEQIIRALRESEERYRYLVESGPDAIAVIQDNRHKLINAQFTRLLGYTREDIDKGLSALETVNETARREILERSKRQAAGEQTPMGRWGKWDVDLVSKDGRLIPCATSGNIIQYRGRPADLVIIRDMTERKRAEAALRESEERYRYLVESSPDAIAVIQDNRHKLINAQFTRLLGYTREDIDKGLSALETVNETARREILERSKRQPAGEQTPMGRWGKWDVDLVSKDGRLIPCATSGNIIQYRGQPADLITIRDMTERKRAEAALRKSEEALKTKARDLQEVNTALRVLLKQREQDKAVLEKKVLLNTEQRIQPFLEKLKKSRLDDQQRSFLDILESNLNDIISPFSLKLYSKRLKLTPAETQICNLIKHGKTSPEIADLLYVSDRTIAAHRRNIRRKLGLKNKKQNLQAYLLTLDND